MAKKGVIALLSCAFVLCFALAGCGGNGGNSAADYKGAFVGTWDLVEMSQDGESIRAEELDLMKAMGKEVYANFNEDGTVQILLFGGDVIEGTWEATNADAGTIEIEGVDGMLSLSDSRLTYEQDGATLVFEKGEAKEISLSATEGESGSAVSGESAETADENATTSEETGSAEAEGSSESASADEAGESESSSSSAAE